MRNNEWQKYVTDRGDFEFPKYLYKTNSDLMKLILDYGTLVCQDQFKLRAYKERVKAAFKQRWIDIASSLEYFDIIRPCACFETEFCHVCGGSRYVLDESLTADAMRQISFVTTAGATSEVMAKLEVGLRKALLEVEGFMFEEEED